MRTTYSLAGSFSQCKSSEHYKVMKSVGGMKKNMDIGY